MPLFREGWGDPTLAELVDEALAETGVGFYFRNVTELILFGVRGQMRTLPPGRRQVNMIETRKREHSRKPDEQYNVIEACSPGPHLEMFARYPRAGWTSWGLEADEDTAPRGKQYPTYRGSATKDPDTQNGPTPTAAGDQLPFGPR